MPPTVETNVLDEKKLGSSALTSLSDSFQEHSSHQPLFACSFTEVFGHDDNIDHFEADVSSLLRGATLTKDVAADTITDFLSSAVPIMRGRLSQYRRLSLVWR